METMLNKNSTMDQELKRILDEEFQKLYERSKNKVSCEREEKIIPRYDPLDPSTYTSVRPQFVRYQPGRKLIEEKSLAPYDPFNPSIHCADRPQFRRYRPRRKVIEEESLVHYEGMEPTQRPSYSKTIVISIVMAALIFISVCISMSMPEYRGELGMLTKKDSEGILTKRDSEESDLQITKRFSTNFRGYDFQRFAIHKYLSNSSTGHEYDAHGFAFAVAKQFGTPELHSRYDYSTHGTLLIGFVEALALESVMSEGKNTKACSLELFIASMSMPEYRGELGMLTEKDSEGMLAKRDSEVSDLQITKQFRTNFRGYDFQRLAIHKYLANSFTGHEYDAHGFAFAVVKQFGTPELHSRYDYSTHGTLLTGFVEALALESVMSEGKNTKACSLELFIAKDLKNAGAVDGLVAEESKHLSVFNVLFAKYFNHWGEEFSNSSIKYLGSPLLYGIMGVFFCTASLLLYWYKSWGTGCSETQVMQRTKSSFVPSVQFHDEHSSIHAVSSSYKSLTTMRKGKDKKQQNVSSVRISQQTQNPTKSSCSQNKQGVDKKQQKAIPLRRSERIRNLTKSVCAHK